MPADLSHIDIWIFDLDNTLYPPGSEFMTLMEGRMTEFVARETGLPREEARALQKKYLHEHGTTLAGMMAHHGMAPEPFLTEVHDVSMDSLQPIPGLAEAIVRLPGRRLVFTNGDARHASRVLAHLGLDALFEDVFHIAAADYIPKPRPEAFARMIARHGVEPARAAFFEDSERNLEPAARLGITTILVGPAALASTAPFVQHRTDDLAAFLKAAIVRDTAVSRTKFNN
ncbi:MAG TPA: pyrimidine 5'-nucleotidase [Caulobacteraceae bacterium]|nr:pyrimidine 5'-nucleotidase [Caulobacteraceae bacterium]